MSRNASGLTATIVATLAALLAGDEPVPAAERVANNSTDCLTSSVGSPTAFTTISSIQDPCEPEGGTAPSGLGKSKTVSNDGTSRFVALVLHKSIAFDLPTDVSDVLVSNSAIANAVLRSKRRAYVIGTGLGQTNVYFYDAKGQQIEGLNVNVAHHLVTERKSAREVMVVRGAEENAKQIQIYECVPACSPAENASPAAPLPNYFILPNVTSVPGQVAASGGGR